MRRAHSRFALASDSTSWEPGELDGCVSRQLLMYKATFGGSGLLGELCVGISSKLQ